MFARNHACAFVCACACSKIMVVVEIANVVNKNESETTSVAVVDLAEEGLLRSTVAESCVAKDNDTTRGPPPRNHDRVRKRLFLPLQQFTVVLAHFCQLRILLLTGGHVTKSSAPRELADKNKSKKRRLARDETLSRDNDNNNDERKCSICMDASSNIVLPCTHKFCYSCARTWIHAHAHCPLCCCHVPSGDVDKELWQLRTQAQAIEARRRSCHRSGLRTFGRRGFSLIRTSIKRTNLFLTLHAADGNVVQQRSCGIR